MTIHRQDSMISNRNTESAGRSTDTQRKASRNDHAIAGWGEMDNRFRCRGFMGNFKFAAFRERDQATQPPLCQI